MNQKTPKTQKSSIALLSVYHKEGIVEFARELHNLGWRLIASGGTAKAIKEADLPVRDVAEIVSGGEILGHRVVTLSREIHAGLLARDTEEDRQELESLEIPRIDLVCVDLYPLEEEIATADSTRESVIEKTDVGGPTLLHSAAKGERIVVSDPADREKVIEWLKSGKPEEEKFKRQLAAKAEGVVSSYILTSARYQSKGDIDGLVGKKTQTCKYGENAWQEPAALLSEYSRRSDPLSLGNFETVLGTLPSYNNLADIDRLLQTTTHIAAGFAKNKLEAPYIAVAVKHGNPCGAAVADSPQEAIKKAVAGDTRAIFGGVVMLNFKLDKEAAELLRGIYMPEGSKRPLDAIAAPSAEEKALEILSRKGEKCRVLINSALSELDEYSLDNHIRIRMVRGGFLKQPNYTFTLNLSDNENVFVYGERESGAERDLILAWAVGSTSNSNTITLTKEGMLIGNGVAQQDRVGAAKLALMRAKDAGHKPEGASAYSDSFFPFTDGVQTLAKAGVKTIFASSGSIRDEEIIKYCRQNNITLYMAPDKAARGFFGH